MGKYNTIGSRIRARRQLLSLSQTELAEKIHCTQAALSQYENGNREPGLQELVQLATALYTSADYLLGVTDIESVDPDVKMIGDYLGLTEQSIGILRELYLKHKQNILEDSLQNEVKCYSGAQPGDKDYNHDLLYVFRYAQQDLDDYTRFVNEFICSSAFKIMEYCLCNNLFVERTIYDLLRVAARRYDEIESVLPESNMAAKAYALVDDTEDFITKYSINIFDAQTALLEFCKDFTKLERVKELDYKEQLYQKAHYFVYHYTRPMFERGNYSVEQLNQELSKDDFHIAAQIEDLLKL